MQETQYTRVRSPCQEDPLEEDIATHSSILAWRFPWTEEPGGLQWGRKELDWSNLAPKDISIPCEANCKSVKVFLNERWRGALVQVILRKLLWK